MTMRIGIAGAGGIGSNVARHLVQAGVTDLLIVDFDRVEISNLNRQFYSVYQAGESKAACLKTNLNGINPDVQIEVLDHQIRPGDATALFQGCTIVVEGFDDALAKKCLVEELAEQNIPLVCASGIAGRDMAGVKTRQVGNCWIVGDFATDVADDILFPPKIGMIAAIMAGIVLDLMTKGDAQE